MPAAAKALSSLVALALAFGAPSTAAAAQQGGDGGPDILPLALITMGSIFGAAALGFALHLIRQRLGFWLHRPPESNPDEREEHH